jgi:plasmid stabilization system protein ParE
MPSKLPPLGPKSLRLTRTADADLNEITDYIAAEASIDVAEHFAERLDAELVKLVRLGHAGVGRDAISPGLRMTVFGSYCIYFRVADTETIIVHVLHSARDVRRLSFEAEE